MNKTAVFITFGVLAALGLIGAIVLLIHRPDATATFTSFVVQILGIAAVAAGTFYGFGKTNEKLETVQKQTNGTLSALREDNARLYVENAKLNRQLTPDSTTDSDSRE